MSHSVSSEHKFISNDKMVDRTSPFPFERVLYFSEDIGNRLPYIFPSWLLVLLFDTHQNILYLVHHYKPKPAKRFTSAKRLALPTCHSVAWTTNSVFQCLESIRYLELLWKVCKISSGKVEYQYIKCILKTSLNPLKYCN